MEEGKEVCMEASHDVAGKRSNKRRMTQGEKGGEGEQARAREEKEKSGKGRSMREDRLRSDSVEC